MQAYKLRQHRWKSGDSSKKPPEQRALNAVFGAATTRTGVRTPPPITLAPVKGPTLADIEAKYGPINKPKARK